MPEHPDGGRSYPGGAALLCSAMPVGGVRALIEQVRSFEKVVV